MRWFCVRLFGLPTNSRLWTKLRKAHDEAGVASIDDIDRELGIVRE